MPSVTPTPETPSPGEDAISSEAGMQAQRESLRMGLLRANLAAVLILVLVAALAAGVVWKARESAGEAVRANEEAQRANRETERARKATEQTEAQLWKSRLNELRAQRAAARPGTRLSGRAMLEELCRRPDLTEEERLALREEAIEQLALMDIELAATTITNSRPVNLTWSHDLKRYCWFRADGAVEIREHPSGKPAAAFPALPGAGAQSAAFSPDHRFAAVRHHGGQVRVWDIAAGDVFLTNHCVRAAGNETPLMFSPDSQWLGMFTATGFMLQPMAKAGAARALQAGRVVDGAVFTTDARRLAVLPRAEPDMVEVWDVETGVVRRRFQPSFRPNAIEWHPDGRRLAVSGSRGLVTMWEMESSTGAADGATNSFPRESMRFTGHLGTIIYLMFTPDGSRLFTQSWDSTCRFWDVMSGAEMFRETRMAILGVSQDGSSLVGIAPGSRESICRLVTPTGYRTVASAGGPRATHGVWLSQDARLLAVGYPPGVGEKTGEVRLWDFQRQIELRRVPGIWAQFSPDNRWMYTFQFGGIHRYDVRAETLASPPANWTEGQLLYTPPKGESVNTGELTDNGRTLVVAAMNHVLWLDAESGRVTRRISAPAHYLSASRDGLRIATSYQNQPAVLRSALGGPTVARSKTFGHSLFSPDTNWVAVAEIDSLRVRRHPSLELAFESALDLGASTPPAIAFSPDSRVLAVAHNRTGIRLHELPSGRVLAKFSGPSIAQIVGAHGIEFSQDGRWLIVARDNGDVVGWELDIMRRDLTTLGLDWAQPTANTVVATNLSKSATNQAGRSVSIADRRDARQPPRRGIETAALIAALITLAAGLVVFAVQRRMLSSYGRVEALAVDQRRRLDSAQAELLHGQKMRALGTLAAGIAHDFNNLLSVIRLSNQLAAEQTKPSGVAKENVDAIESAVTQGESIVQSMLGYSRAAADLDTRYAVDGVVNETVAMLGKKFLAGIILKLEIEAALPPAQGSRGRLEQMLLNLIVNASEAMAGKGTLSIKLRRVSVAGACLLAPRAAPGFIELMVGDSGPGIPPEVLPRIFEPFFTTKKLGARPGTGLGLATVYTMAEQDGLGLGVETRSEAGTTFRILVPMGTAAAKESV